MYSCRLSVDIFPRYIRLAVGDSTKTEELEIERLLLRNYDAT